MWGLINGCQPSDDRPASETARSNDMMSNTTSDVMNEETPDLGVTDHGSPDRGVFDQEMTDLAVTDMSMSHIRDYELDDVLSLHHVQSLGTHNSYHPRPRSPREHLSFGQQSVLLRILRRRGGHLWRHRDTCYQ